MAKLVDQVVGVLSEDLGPSQALASVRMYLQKTNLSEETIAQRDLMDLADRLEPGLRVFVGAARAGALARRIRSLSQRGEAD